MMAVFLLNNIKRKGLGNIRGGYRNKEQYLCGAKLYITLFLAIINYISSV